MTLRRCLDCTELTDRGSRCKPCEAVRQKTYRDDEGKGQQYGPAYRQEAKAIREADADCYICGQRGTPDDPIAADHVKPRGAELAPAHTSCNAAKGQQLDKPYLRGDITDEQWGPALIEWVRDRRQRLNAQRTSTPAPHPDDTTAPADTPTSADRQKHTS